MPNIDKQGSIDVYRNMIGRMSGVILLLCLFNLFMGCSVTHHRTSDKYAQYKGELNQHTRLIRCESRRVFHILTHQDEFKNICPKGTIVTFEPNFPYRVGTIVHTKIDHIFKLSWRSQVVEINQYRKIRLQFLNGYFAGGTEIWELVPENNTSTKVTHTIIFQHQGFLKKLAWKLKVGRKHDKMVEALLDNFKRKAETQ